MTRPRSIPALFLALLGTSFVAQAEPSIECKSGKVDVLAGTLARAGMRYSTATEMLVSAPATPPGWTVHHCNADGVTFSRQDPDAKVFLTAIATGVLIAPWSDEQAFAERVRQIVEKSDPRLQHVKIVDVKSTTVDRRPCIDVRRSGTVDAPQTPDGKSSGTLVTREFLRACHLRDARGPEAAVMIVFKAVGLRDMPGFDDASQAFADGVTLPPWMQAHAAAEGVDARSQETHRATEVRVMPPRRAVDPNAVPRPPRLAAADSSCRPEYPPAAIRAMAQGRTVMSFDVDAAGQVTQSTIVQASGPTREHRMLDTSAAAALSRCRIDPARDSDGHPVPGSFAVTYDWKIDASPPAAGAASATGSPTTRSLDASSPAR
jgi:TonB family protein